MTLSKARNRVRMRKIRAEARGEEVHLSATDEFSLLPLYRRKEVLAAIALHRIEAPVTAGHIIAAVKECNLMEHVYDEAPEKAVAQQTFVFIMPEGTRVTPGELIRDVPKLEAGDATKQG